MNEERRQEFLSWIQRVNAREPKSVADFIRYARATVMQVASSRVKDPDLLQDAIQNGTIIALAVAQRYDGRVGWSAYLRKSLTGTVLNTIREAQVLRFPQRTALSVLYHERVLRLDLLPEDEPGPYPVDADPEAGQDDIERLSNDPFVLDRLRVAVQELRSREREILWFYFFEELDLGEIAQKLQISRQGAQQRLKKAVEELRKGLRCLLQ